MDEDRLVLDRRIRKDLEVVEKLWDELEAIQVRAMETDKRDVVYAGYRLHNLYSAAENIFHNISNAFGNHIEGKSGWHAELLDRMRLDLTPLRPAVIDDTTFDDLDELRRFRHVFRAAYSTELDAERMALVLRKALTLREHFPNQIESFLKFLGSLDS